MLRGNPPPPPTSPFFFCFLSLFLHFSKKKSENFGGGLNPLNPPLKYALVGYISSYYDYYYLIAITQKMLVESYILHSVNTL